MKTLKEAYKEYFPIGVAVSPEILRKQGVFIAEQFDSITAENEMKFDALEPELGRFEFEEADQMVAFAREHQLKMRGHTLVWHQQIPQSIFEWENGGIISREESLKRMGNHIQRVVDRYKEDVYCWDVLNEVINDGEGYLRDTKWLQVIGEDYMEYAFRFAYEADSKSVLFYNDYNAIVPKKRDKIYELVKGLKAKGVPIHGIGIQGHWNIGDHNAWNLEAALKKFARLDLQIQITELDMSMYAFSDAKTHPELKGPTYEMLKRQEEEYDAVFRLFRRYKDYISGVTFWGVSDDYTWLDNFPVKYRKNWPFLFDEKGEVKAAYSKVINFNK